MEIKCFKTGPIRTNTYIVSDLKTRESVIIDPAGKVDDILTYIKQAGIKPKMIVNTHGHYDHILANKELSDKLGIEICIHKSDSDMLVSDMKSHARKNGLKIAHKRALRLLEDGEIIHIGEMKLEVIHTPGHTEGGICLYNSREKILISGDTLFCGTYGRTDLPESDPKKMNESIQKLLILPADTKVYPGHGRATTIENERNSQKLKNAIL